MGAGEYLHAQGIACALAHPFSHVAAPLTPSHRRTLAELFPVWETRNGSRPADLNAPAAVYIETHGGIAIGGSDDHAGVDLGRTYTEAPSAATPAELLAHIRAGKLAPRGNHGTAASWAHSALALAARSLATTGDGRPATTDPTVTDPSAAREQTRLAAPEDEPRRVAVIADGAGSAHGLTQTLAVLRERGIAGHEIDVIGTDATVDRRLTAVNEIELPFYPGFQFGVPSLFAVAEALTDRRYDLVHLCAPGPAAVAAQLVARVMGIPIAGSYDTDFLSLARLRSEDPEIGPSVAAVLEAFYAHCQVVLSPSRAADHALGKLGVEAERLHRWQRGVDLDRFNPARFTPDVLPSDRFNVLYTGRLGHEKGLDLLGEAFLVARDRDPRLHLVLAGAGPELERLRARLGRAAAFLGWIEGDALAHVYASADLFVFPSTTDTFGRAILEAQASGLPVLAVDGGGAAELIETGRTGCLVPAEPEALAGALRGLARRAALRDRLATGGLIAVRERSWDRSLVQLASSWTAAIDDRRPAATPAKAAATTTPEVARAA